MDNYQILYKNHGANIGSWEIWTEGDFVHTRALKVLGGKPTVNQYEAKPKNVGRANATTAAQQAVAESISKAKLKRDKGYVDSLDKADAPVSNTLGLPLPMLAKPFDKVKPESINWQAAYVQPKLDGHRALFKDGVLYSRQGKELENCDHIVQAIKSSGLDHLHLDGELYLHGKTLQELSRMVKKWTPETLMLEYHIYDIVDDWPYLDRARTLAATNPLSWDPVLQIVDTMSISDESMLTAEHERNRAAGYEGTMLRHGRTPYRDGKRCSSLLKLKEFHDAEFDVVFYEEGKPYIRNGVIAGRVPIWSCQTAGGKQFNVTAHGDMDEKNDQWERRDELVGTPLTVKYHNLSKDGIPQLPIALRWREDV